MEQIILALGSNLPDREKHLQNAINEIEKYFGEVKKSTIYEVPALIPEGAPNEWNQDFLNMAISCKSDLTPMELFNLIKKIEKSLGRKTRERWAPREIDIDILARGKSDFISPNLTIPHASLAKRDFAIIPFAELWPDWLYPLKDENFLNSAQEIADKIDNQLKVWKKTL